MPILKNEDIDVMVKMGLLLSSHDFFDSNGEFKTGCWNRNAGKWEMKTITRDDYHRYGDLVANLRYEKEEEDM